MPPKLIEDIVHTYRLSALAPSKIFNQSIGSKLPCELKHMSAWAAAIDAQCYENDVLFVQAAGNVDTDTIAAYIQAGYPYPDYLERELCRICDPGQSLQALTVGSVALSDYQTEDTEALGGKDHISAFSRSGPGIWDVVKPDVVEYGGTMVVPKEGHLTFTTPKKYALNWLGNHLWVLRIQRTRLVLRLPPQGYQYCCKNRIFVSRSSSIIISCSRCPFCTMARVG